MRGKGKEEEGRRKGMKEGMSEGGKGRRRKEGGRE